MALQPLPLLIFGLAVLFGGSTYAQTLTVSRGARVETVSVAQIAALPHVKVHVDQHGHSHDFEGAPLSAILARVGVDVSRPLTGPNLAGAIRVTAADGYQVVLALSEIDPATRAGAVVLADREGGKAIADTEGPFRLVVADDLRPARSARQVIKIEVLDLASSGARSPVH